jgi:protein-S-isoprenylcysteine O-methyltransferase
VLTLRRYFTVTVAIRADHKLVDWGLYRYVRHPSYSGAIVSLFGLGLGSGGWLAALVVVSPIVWAVVRRIRVEESALGDGLGPEYHAWRQRTPLLFPHCRSGNAR